MDRQHGGNARDTEALVKTRRAILLGGAGLAAAAAGSLAAAAPAKAANGEDVVLGATNMASSSTDIVSTGTDETLTVVSTRAIGLFAYDNGTQEYGNGIGTNPIRAIARGHGDGTGNVWAAIEAASAGGGPAIQAEVLSGAPAIVALSSGGEPSISAVDSSVYGPGTGIGVSAQLFNAFNPSSAVQATTAGTGSAIDAAVTNTGSSAAVVKATTRGMGNALLAAVQHPKNKGAAILGTTNGAGQGVKGTSGNIAGVGVVGQGTKGATGLEGTSDTGIGILGRSTSGDALKVVGKVAFSRSGLATVAAHAASVTVSLTGVTTSTLIIATLQTDAGAIAVANAVPASGSFTVHLTAAPITAVKVAWFVIG